MKRAAGGFDARAEQEYICECREFVHGMGLWGTPRKSHAARLSEIIHWKFIAKVHRGMKVRTVGDNQVLLEDTDEWLHKDSQMLHIMYPEAVLFDVYSCTSYETSISGLCIAITILPYSRLWTVLGWLHAIFLSMIGILWLFVMYQTHPMHPFAQMSA